MLVPILSFSFGLIDQDIVQAQGTENLHQESEEYEHQQVVMSENDISIDDNGAMHVGYSTENIDNEDIVSIELKVNDRRIHRWHRDEEENTSDTTYGQEFTGSDLTFLKDVGYPEGEYSLDLAFDDNILTPTRVVSSDSHTYTPPEEHRTYSNWNSQSVPLDEKIEYIYQMIVTFVAGPLAVLFLVYAGYLYITSAGNPEQLGMAKDMIVSTITAIVILLLAGLILRTIGETRVADPASLGGGGGQAEEEQVENEGGQSGEEAGPTTEETGTNGEAEGSVELEDAQTQNSDGLETYEESVDRREGE